MYGKTVPGRQGPFYIMRRYEKYKCGLCVLDFVDDKVQQGGPNRLCKEYDCTGGPAPDAEFATAIIAAEDVERHITASIAAKLSGA